MLVFLHYTAPEIHVLQSKHCEIQSKGIHPSLFIQFRTLRLGPGLYSGESMAVQKTEACTRINRFAFFRRKFRLVVETHSE
ncbi:hypothetical protein CDAR_242721, partial [Caerostris darwini]